MIGEIGQHGRLLAVEMVENADLVRADMLSGVVVANVPAVTGEVDAWIVAEDGGRRRGAGA